jgi:hypothetical protein
MNLKRVLTVISCIIILGITYLTKIICSECYMKQDKTNSSKIL